MMLIEVELVIKLSSWTFNWWNSFSMYAGWLQWLTADIWYYFFMLVFVYFILLLLLFFFYFLSSIYFYFHFFYLFVVFPFCFHFCLFFKNFILKFFYLFFSFYFVSFFETKLSRNQVTENWHSTWNKSWWLRTDINMDQFFRLRTAKKSHISLMSHERSWSQSYFSSMNMALNLPCFHVINT